MTYFKVQADRGSCFEEPQPCLECWSNQWYKSKEGSSGEFRDHDVSR